MSVLPVVPESAGVTPEQRLLIQLSLDKALACSRCPVTLFYERLFEIDPGLRPLFRCDMREQEQRLLGAIADLVEALDTPEVFRSKLRDLGRRHAGYGVEPEHYQTVREALFWALEQCLGATFTADVRVAWRQLYDTIAGEMKRAAE